MTLLRKSCGTIKPKGSYLPWPAAPEYRERAHCGGAEKRRSAEVAEKKKHLPAKDAKEG
jgi:hypothetical protein